MVCLSGFWGFFLLFSLLRDLGGLRREKKLGNGIVRSSIYQCFVINLLSVIPEAYDETPVTILEGAKSLVCRHMALFMFA